MSKTVCVVGAGYWGAKCIDTLLHSAPDVAVVVVEKNSDSRSKLQPRFSHLVIFETVEEALEKESIDAAVIATPASLHGSIALSLLRAGIHVYIEKPFNLSRQEFEEAFYHESRGLVINSGYLYVHNPLIVAVEEITRSATFGELMLVESRREGFGAFRQDVNVVRDLMVHDISIALALCPDQSWSISDANQRIALSTGFFAEAEATMKFEDGVLFKMVASQLRPMKTRRTTFFYEKAIVVIDEENELKPLRVFSLPPNLITSKAQSRWVGDEYAQLIELEAAGFQVDSPRKTLANSLSCFLDAIDRRSSSRTDVSFALRVDEVAKRIEQLMVAERPQ